MAPKAGSANGSGAPRPTNISTSTTAGITSAGSRDRRSSASRLRSLTAVRGGELAPDCVAPARVAGLPERRGLEDGTVTPYLGDD